MLQKRTDDKETTKKSRRAVVRKPEWLRSRLPEGDSYAPIKKMLRERELYTVCEEARCPNLGTCWSGGTATFMIMGDTCTRGCRFCAVKTRKTGIPLDPNEPRNVAESVNEMALDYVVLTSVDRDDLPDDGAGHFAETIRQIYEQSSKPIRVEVLTPDFRGKREAVEAIVAAKPTVFAHNVETVRRLTKTVRDPRCDYDQSINVLRWAKEADDKIVTKTSLMLGLGETHDEIMETMDDLLEAGVQILTFGQYLRPTKKHLPVAEFITPARFEELAEIGKQKGFSFVPSGPLVRSSYKAGEFFTEHFASSQEK